MAEKGPHPQSHEIVKSQREKYVVYKLHVRNAHVTWFVIRRYKEFRALYDVLSKRFKSYSLKIPPKKLFGNFKDSTIQARVKGLNDFLLQVLTIPNILDDGDVADFLRTCDKRVSHCPPRDTVNPVNDDGSQGPDYTDHELAKSLNTKSSPESFHFIKVVGKGRFGRVFLAQHKETEKYFAIKVLSKKSLENTFVRANIMHERNVLVKNFRHPFLVRLHYSFQTKTKLYFVLDYINGGELFFHLQRDKTFPEARAKFYAAEIASALGYLHSQHIVFRDLKPENLLLDRFGHIVITDFGLAKEHMDESNDRTNTFCGTPEYLAPEVLLKRAYTYSVDWWSLGCVLYEMLFGWPPFYSREHQRMYEKIKKQPLEFKSTKYPVSDDAKDILTDLLQKDPGMRLGSERDVHDLKTHDFMSDVSFEALEKREISPPYVPKVRSESATDNIDREFLQSPVGKSVGEGGGPISVGVTEMDNDFSGFTYAPPMEHFHE